MNEEILKLVYNYSKNNRLIDKEYVEKIVDLYIDNFDMNSYINNISYQNVSEDNQTNIAGYSYNRKTIYIFTNRFAQEIERKSNLSKYVPNKQLLFLKNVELTHIILHELEHVIQAKLMSEKNTTESEILKLCGISKSNEIITNRLESLGYQKSAINTILNGKLKKYYEFYEFAPPERLADYNSHKKMVDVLDPIKLRIPQIYDGEVIKMEQILVKGYKFNNKIVSPTKLFLVEQGEEKNLNKFNWYDQNPNISLKKSKKNYSLLQRMKLGLPIEEKEYNKENKKLKRLLLKL